MKQPSAVQISHSLVSNILSKTLRQIDERFYIRQSYKYSASLSVLQLQNIAALERLSETQIHLATEKEPIPLGADSNMPLSLPHNQKQPEVTQKQYESKTLSSLKASGSLIRSKTFTEGKFKREWKASSKGFNNQLQPLEIDNPEQGYLNGLRQLKYDQEKYKGKKEEPKKVVLKKEQVVNPAFDYTGQVLKMKQAESAHVIRANIKSRLLSNKTSLTSIKHSNAPKLIPQQQTLNLISKIYNSKRSMERSNESEYTHALPMGEIELKEGVRLIMGDGSVLERKVQEKTFKDLMKEDRRNLSSKEFNRLKALKEMQFEQKFKIKMQINSNKKSAPQPVSTRNSAIPNPQAIFHTHEMGKKAERELKDDILQNRFQVLPRMKVKKYESMIRTRREVKSSKDTVSQKSRKFEDSLRTIF